MWTTLQDNANRVQEVWEVHCNYWLLWSIHGKTIFTQGTGTDMVQLETPCITPARFWLELLLKAAFLLYHKHGEAVCLIYTLLNIVEYWTNFCLAILYRSLAKKGPVSNIRPPPHYCVNFLQRSKVYSKLSAHPIDLVRKVFSATWCKVSLQLHRNDAI